MNAAGTNTPPRVLLPVHTNTFFIEMQRVARLLKASGTYEPVLLFAWPYPTLASDVDLCISESLTCLDSLGEPIQSGESARPSATLPEAAVSPSLLERIAQVVEARTGWSRERFRRERFGELDFYLRFHRERQRLARHILSKDTYAAIVMAGDMVGYDSSDWIQVAHEFNAPVILVPSTMSNGREQAEVYYHDPAYHVVQPPARLAARLFPKWKREHRGRELLRRPPGDVFAMEWLRTAPPLPWMFNSGFADVIAAESDAMVDYYVSGGLPRQQLEPTGTLANDVLASQLAQADVKRRELVQQLGLTPGLRMALVAIPPDFLYVNGARPECDFRTYPELLDFWISSLRVTPGWNVVLSLHPSVSPESFRHLESEHIKIGPPNTASLIPLCDLYVASVSSTIRWAIACGKPVINYDVYRYRYDDFLAVPGVLAMEEQAEFRELLTRLTTVPEALEEVRARQAAAAARWGNLDGKCGQRFLQLLDRQIAIRRA